MIFKCGIIGLPNVGKSSLFNALTCSSVKSENFPFCTIKANHGLFTILDFRLYKLFKFIRSKEMIFDNIKIIDIAGLIEGASNGAGLGNKFLSDIIEVDILCHVVRCFDQNDIYHISSNIDPKKDIEIINNELILSDISRCERLISLAKKINNDNRKKNIKDITRILLLEKCLGYLYNRIMLYQ